MIDIKPVLKTELIEIKEEPDVIEVNSIEPVAGPSRKRKGKCLGLNENKLINLSISDLQVSFKEEKAIINEGKTKRNFYISFQVFASIRCDNEKT